MVSQRLKKHDNELVYLQKARPCIRKHLITKADRSLVDCLCECADNILRGNVPLTKPQIYKTSCKAKKAQTSSDEATEHIERHLRLKMALVHQNSCECTKSELDLFGVPPTQTSVEHGYWEQKGLTSTLTNQGPYEFAVSGAGDDYIDLFNTYLFVEAQIVNTDGSNLEPDTDVGPVDLWMHSLFSDVSVSLSEKLVSPPTSMYPYRAYIENLLSYGPAAKESQLTGVMW